MLKKQRFIAIYWHKYSVAQRQSHSWSWIKEIIKFTISPEWLQWTNIETRSKVPWCPVTMVTYFELGLIIFPFVIRPSSLNSVTWFTTLSLLVISVYLNLPLVILEKKKGRGKMTIISALDLHIYSLLSAYQCNFFQNVESYFIFFSALLLSRNQSKLLSAEDSTHKENSFFHWIYQGFFLCVWFFFFFFFLIFIYLFFFFHRSRRYFNIPYFVKCVLLEKIKKWTWWFCLKKGGKNNKLYWIGNCKTAYCTL